mgnify:CR=1 FL=1
MLAVASLLLLTTVASSIESEEVVTLPSGLSYVVLRDGTKLAVLGELGLDVVDDDVPGALVV